MSGPDTAILHAFLVTAAMKHNRKGHLYIHWRGKEIVHALCW